MLVLTQGRTITASIESACAVVVRKVDEERTKDRVEIVAIYGEARLPTVLLGEYVLPRGAEVLRELYDAYETRRTFVMPKE